MLEIETLCKMRHIKWGGCCERRGIHGKCQIAKCKKMQNQRNFKSMLNITCKMPLLREKRRGRTKVHAYCILQERLPHWYRWNRTNTHTQWHSSNIHMLAIIFTMLFSWDFAPPPRTFSESQNPLWVVSISLYWRKKLWSLWIRKPGLMKQKHSESKFRWGELKSTDTLHVTRGDEILWKTCKTWN